jgi:PPE-repeat protein
VPISPSQAEQTANQARAAAAAFEAAFAATVPPPVIAANRSLLSFLIATNILGQNTLAIAATEAQYAEMWAQDAAAMYSYAGSSAAAATLSPFTPPQQTTNPAGLAAQGSAVAQTTNAGAATNMQAALAQLTSTVPTALQGLASPLSSTSVTADAMTLLNLVAPGCRSEARPRTARRGQGKQCRPNPVGSSRSAHHIRAGCCHTGGRPTSFMNAPYAATHAAPVTGKG